jgi:hypothetical protein
VGNGWIAALGLVVALHCYDLYDASLVWQGVAVVNEDEWRFEVVDADGRSTERGEADAFAAVLRRLGLTERPRPCATTSLPCYGRATRC